MKKRKNNDNLDSEFACTYFRAFDDAGNELVAVTGQDCITHTFILLGIEEVQGEPILILTPREPDNDFSKNEIVLYRIIKNGKAIVLTGRRVLSDEEFALFNAHKPKAKP